MNCTFALMITAVFLSVGNQANAQQSPRSCAKISEDREGRYVVQNVCDRFITFNFCYSGRVVSPSSRKDVFNVRRCAQATSERDPYYVGSLAIPGGSSSRVTYVGPIDFAVCWTSRISSDTSGQYTCG